MVIQPYTAIQPIKLESALHSHAAALTMDRVHAGQLLPVARNDTATPGLAGVHASAGFELPHGSTPFMPNICALFSANENDGAFTPAVPFIVFFGAGDDAEYRAGYRNDIADIGARSAQLPITGIEPAKRGK